MTVNTMPPPLTAFSRRRDTAAVQLQLYAAVGVAACQDPSLTGILLLRCVNSNIERLPPVSTTSKCSMCAV